MVHDDKPELLFYKTFNMLNKDPQEGWYWLNPAFLPILFFFLQSFLIFAKRIVDPSKLGSSKDASEKTNISVSTTTKDDSSPIIDTEVEKPPSSLMFDKLRAMIPKNVEVSPRI